MLGARGTIDVGAVRRLFRGFESAMYSFLDALLQRDRAASLRHLHALLRAGTHPLEITATLSKQLRALAAARDAGRVQAPALARDAGVSVAQANRALRHGRNFDATELRRAYRALADADLALKGGERGEDQPPELVMELLVAGICGDERLARRPAARAAGPAP
jgi:DNA polymerase III delta subunit